MSAASGTIYTFAAGGFKGLKEAVPLGLASPGNFVALVINIGLLGVAVKVTGEYVGVISVQISLDHGETYQEIDTVTSMQVTKIYTFPQNGPLLFTDFRLSGKTWTSGNAIIEIDPWNPLAVPTIEGSDGVPQPARSPDKFKSIAATAIGNTLVWDPALGKKFRLLSVYVRPDIGALVNVAGDVIVDFRDGNTSIGVAATFYIPKTIAAFPPPEPFFQQDLGPIGYLSSAADNILNVNLSVGLLAGQFRVNVMGTEE